MYADMVPPFNFWRNGSEALPSTKAPIPFAGRIGANQEFAIDQNRCTNTELLEKYPDAAPLVPLRDLLSLKQFLEPELWKAAAIEGIGMPISLEYLVSYLCK